eukprot:Skav224776  [mRNA]  locus=scaffold4598:9218:11521:+ [translate_table: standard]
MHAILGLRKLDGISGPLQEHWQLQGVGRQCMPRSHRNFLENLEHGTSVRAYCLREWRKVPVEGIAALEDAFNNCIEALLKYCSLRQRGLVQRMFPDVSRIRRLSAEQEQVIRSGRLALLHMRRVADAAHSAAVTHPKPPGEATGDGHGGHSGKLLMCSASTKPNWAGKLGGYTYQP